MGAPGEKFPWEEKLLRSGFFIGAVLFHLILFALVADYVIFRAPVQSQTAFKTAHFTSPPRDTPPIQPPEAALTSATSIPLNPADNPGEDIQVCAIGTRPDIGISLFGNPPAPGDLHGPPALNLTPKLRAKGLSLERIKSIKIFEGAHRSWENILNHDPAGDYPVYVAAYADGDWACNTSFDAAGNIVAGSIPNLVAKISEWTHGEVRAHVVAKPLNIGGKDLLDQKPPFIFFTGHKDFVLTPQEVENLQTYVGMGGAIWGDNAEAGTGSRFDVAFRREMKRVIPAEDFQPLSADAEIFKGRFQFDQTPEGMNYLAEPIEHLDLDGKLAILYTPNDYSDLYTMRILPGDEQIQGKLPTADSPLVTSGLFLDNRGVYFRNFTLPSSLAVQHLGLNIVTYLVTRFDDELQLAP